jgi:lipopolysaccharide/colanic/teichoic acid biosynthesis glycosyltransferase
MDIVSRPGFWYQFAKRTLDILLAGAGLLILSPALSLISLFVRISSPGPVLFRQQRLGLNGRVFTVLKFRTMVVHEANTLAEKVVLSSDRRITPLGRILRDFRLDELPQLFNVIRGEMSIVGPRPLTPELLPYYSDTDKQRLASRPGITGWQQVNGALKNSWAERIALDLWYVQHPSIWLDLTIIWRTIGVALKREGVYVSDGSQLSTIPDAFRVTLTEKFGGYDKHCGWGYHSCMAQFWTARCKSCGKPSITIGEREEGQPPPGPWNSSAHEQQKRCSECGKTHSYRSSDLEETIGPDVDPLPGL